jgi:hypothetical protein
LLSTVERKKSIKGIYMSLNSAFSCISVYVDVDMKKGLLHHFYLALI